MLRTLLHLTLVSFVALLIASMVLVEDFLTAQTSTDDGFVPVTDAMLENPAPDDWLMRAPHAGRLGL